MGIASKRLAFHDNLMVKDFKDIKNRTSDSTISGQGNGQSNVNGIQTNGMVLNMVKSTLNIGRKMLASGYGYRLPSRGPKIYHSFRFDVSWSDESIKKIRSKFFYVD